MTSPITQAFHYAVAISIVLVAIPFRWHLRARNTGTCLYMIWIGMGCVNQLVNSIIWAHDAIIRYPIWCDISVHLQVALNTAIPACSLVISRRLFFISNGRNTTNSKDGKHKEVIFDLCLGLGIPLLSAGLSVIPQGHRFNIFEEIGCQPAIYSTVAALLLVNIWPLVIAFCSATYTCFTIHNLVKRNSKIRELIGTDSNLTFSRYWRFISLSMGDIVFTIPLYTFSLYITVLNLRPWISWDNVHYDFGRVEQYTALFWRQDPLAVAGLELNRWGVVLPAFLAFALFGFGAEAMKDYRWAWSSISAYMARVASILRPKPSLTTLMAARPQPYLSQGNILPIFVPLDRSQDSPASTLPCSSATNSILNLHSDLSSKNFQLGQSGPHIDHLKAVPIPHF